jgi:hypothetical protein
MAIRAAVAGLALWVAGAVLVHAQQGSPEAATPFAGIPRADDAPRADTAQIAPRVRCLTPVARMLVREGFEASPTFRALVREIERTDVTVLVVTGRWEPEEGSAHANLRFIGRGSADRFLRIFVDPWWRTRREQVALLAHELQHAIEIGQEREVRTTAGVDALYQRIGQRVGERCYETRAAKNAGAQVDAELGSPRHLELAVAR